MRRTEEGQKRVRVTSFINQLQPGLDKSNNFVQLKREPAHTGPHERAFSSRARCKNSTISERDKTRAVVHQALLFYLSSTLFIAAMKPATYPDDFHVNAGITDAFQRSRTYRGVSSARTFFNIALRVSEIAGFNGQKEGWSLDIRFNSSFVYLFRKHSGGISSSRCWSYARIIITSFIKPVLNVYAWCTSMCTSQRTSIWWS